LAGFGNARAVANVDGCGFAFTHAYGALRSGLGMSAARIAVVGAGVAGCAAALALARQGHEVHLIEAVAQPEPVGAGVLLQPTGQEVLRRLGLHEAIHAHGASVLRLWGDDPQGRTVLDMAYSEGSLPGYVRPHGLGVQRGALMGLLWQAVRSSPVHWHCGHSVTGWDGTSAGVKLQFSESAAQASAVPAELTSNMDVLVLANGSFSALRQHMPVRQRARRFPWGALWCLLPEPAGVAGEPARAQLRQRYRAARQMLGLMPVGRAFTGSATPQPSQPAMTTFFWSLHERDLQAWQERPNLTTIKKDVLDLWPDVAPWLATLTDPDTLKVARYADVNMQPWHHGPVVAIGDCGHGMSPQLGQGANMALIDAWALAACIGQTQAQAGCSTSDWPQALAHYSSRRRAHLRFYQAASRWMTPLFQSHQRAGPWLRDVFLPRMGRLPWVQAQGLATLSGVKGGWWPWARLEL
jgi:2-polyprenyl-6-methoxyphenol hydroxylase-like FAD-dependent oxidoreductase